MSAAVSSFCGSRAAAFKHNAGLTKKQPATRGAMAMVMRKKGIHPEWYSDAKVLCNGVEVMTVGGTKKEYNVDIYSGNHPFYQGMGSVVVMDEGQLNKFKKRFAGLEEYSNVVTANSAAAAAAAGGDRADDAAPPAPKAAPQKGKGSKKGGKK